MAKLQSQKGFLTLMNRKELIKAVATNAMLTQKQADAALTAIVNAIEDTVAERGSVSILGFGTFSAQTKAAKTGRNPRTGEAVTVPAKTVPVFKAGKAFKEKVNKK
jgi:DNA-binding protein HU-beta